MSEAADDEMRMAAPMAVDSLPPGAPATRVLIVGYGAFGRAFHHALSPREDVAISVYSRSSKEFDIPVVRAFDRPEAIPMDAFNVVVVALPGHAVRDVLRPACQGSAANPVFLSCVKGMEARTGQFPSEIIYEATGSSTIAVTSGASFADEMLAGHPVFLTLACENLALGRELVDRLESRQLRFELTGDVRGLEVAGVGKNIIAVGAGMSDGLGLGENFRASLIARGIVELRDLAEHLGGEGETITSGGALADFFLTCLSPKSRNYLYGRRVASGEDPSGLTAEGRDSAASFVRLLQTQRIESPYFETIVAALEDPPRIRTILEANQGG